jgi:large subunit ribosomal protein L24
MVVCPNCGKPTRVAHARLDDQHKTRVRVCRHCGEQLEVGT